MEQNNLLIKIYHQVDIYFDELLNDSTQEYLHSEIQTDENHNIIMERIYNAEGEILTEHYCTFNEHNKKTTEIQKENGAIIENTEYKFEGDLLIEESHIYEGGLSEKTINQYDTNNILISKISYDSDNNMTEKLIYTSKDNHIIKIEYEDEDGNKSPYQDFQYDDKGNLITILYVNLDDKIIETNNTYNDNNKLIKTIVYNEFKNIDHIETYEYDERERITKSVRQEPDRKITFLTQYDDNDNIVGSEILNSLGEIVQETQRQYIDGRISNMLSITYDKNSGRKDIEKSRWEYHYQ